MKYEDIKITWRPETEEEPHVQEVSATIQVKVVIKVNRDVLKRDPGVKDEAEKAVRSGVSERLYGDIQKEILNAYREINECIMEHGYAPWKVSDMVRDKLLPLVKYGRRLVKK